MTLTSKVAPGVTWDRREQMRLVARGLSPLGCGRGPPPVCTRVPAHVNSMYSDTQTCK